MATENKDILAMFHCGIGLPKQRLEPVHETRTPEETEAASTFAVDLLNMLRITPLET
ncbi:MAG: hypothetical protein ACI9H6_000025 [Patiriisocius sp.]|jgi:hypothetical protein